MDRLALLALLVAGVTLVLPIAAILVALTAKAGAKRAAVEIRELELQLAAATRRNLELDQRLNTWIARFQQQLAAQGRAAAHDAAAPAVVHEAWVSAVPAADTTVEGPAAAVVASLSPDITATTSPEAQGQPKAVASQGTNLGAPSVSQAPTLEVSHEAAASTAAEVPATPGSDGPPEASAALDRDAVMDAVQLRGIDWERLVGVRLFAWVGGAALFLAAALFLHYSIQRDLISPELRVAIGLVGGALCLALGDRLRARTPFSGFALSGAGVAILYAALFAARALYDLIGTAPAFAGMSLVTLTAGFIAVKRNAYFVALMGLTGGMATPYLLSSGEDRPLALFAYVALLSGAVLVVARLRRWASLGLLGTLFSAAVFTGWSLESLEQDRVPFALAAATVVCAMFALTRIAEPTPKGSVTPERLSLLATVSTVVALFVPLAIALTVVNVETLRVEPLVLSLHLVAVSGIAVLVARQRSLAWLLVIAASCSLLALLQRVDDDLFPSRRELALVSMSLPAIAHFFVWLWRRGSGEAPAARLSTLILLGGALAIVLRVADVEPSGSSFAAPLAYAALHAALLVAMGAVAAQGLPVALGQGVLLLSLVALSTVSLHEYEVSPAALVSAMCFFALPTLHARWRSERLAWASSACALPAGFLLVFSFAHDHFGYDLLGGLALLAAALEVGMLAFVATRRELPQGVVLFLRALFGALALGFLTAAVPILLRNEWLTISWALEVAALAWLHRRIPHRGLVLFAGCMAAAVSVRILMNPAVYNYHLRAETPILNHYLYTIGVPAAAFFLAARLFVLPPEYAWTRLKGLLRVAATLFLFMVLNIEIADYYSTGATLSFRWSGGGLAQDMTYSLAWGVFALALLFTGILLRQRPVRIGALVVLVLTIGKVFLHDLWELGALYRVGSIVGLAVALLGVSFLTQRLILDKEGG